MAQAQNITPTTCVLESNHAHIEGQSMYSSNVEEPHLLPHTCGPLLLRVVRIASFQPILTNHSNSKDIADPPFCFLKSPILHY